MAMTLGPNSPAILDSDILWSSAELDRQADAVVAHLRAAGLEPGDRVGLVAESSAVVVAAFHGLLRAGFVIVPIGPRLAAPEVDALRSAAGLRAVLSGEKLELAPGAPARAPDSAAVIVPTSGTTARPKLVRLGRAQLDASADAWTAVLPPATGWLLSLGLAHVSGIGVVVRAQRAGVPIVIPRNGESSLDTFARARAHGIAISHVSMVATQLARLLGSGVAPPPELRAVILGGGPIPESLVVVATAAGWPIVPSYGLTETASGVVAVPPAEAAARPWSAGRRMPDVELEIAAPDRDGIGEILVRGPMVFDGYEGDPALTAAALDPDGWLHTGDLGSLDRQGWLRVAGRRDELIISGGENVAPAEVEAVLAAHPSMADVAVVGVPDQRWGSVPVALVAFRPDMREPDDRLRAFALERLAPFKVPTRFVEVAAIPRTANGKLLRRQLPPLLTAAGRRPSLAGTTTIYADDRQPLALRDLAGPPEEAGPRTPTFLLLHATLSTSGQLLRLGQLLQKIGRVLMMDRRGSGASQMESPGPVSVARHVADVVAVMDAAGVERAAVFGHSFGALVAIELAARHPDRVASVLAFEPPYLALAEPETLARLVSLREELAAAYARGGPAPVAQLFLSVVGGVDALDRLSPVQRAFVEAEGTSALADISMSDLDPDGLARIVCPVVLVIGGASEPFYMPIADALAARIPGARHVTLPGLLHTAPITEPSPVAELLRGQLSDPA